jgi:hypothetical protein
MTAYEKRKREARAALERLLAARPDLAEKIRKLFEGPVS